MILGFLQLRPSLAYLDNMKRKRDASSANNDSDDEAEAGPSNAEQVTVKFARTENDKLKKNNAASYKKLQEKSSQETWMDCTWQALNSTYSEVSCIYTYHCSVRNNDATNIGIMLNANIKPMVCSAFCLF